MIERGVPVRVKRSAGDQRAPGDTVDQRPALCLRKG